MNPTTHYAQSGDASIAYQVVGDGPVDLVWVVGVFSNIEVMWEEPLYADFLRRLAEFSRVIIFDKRGTGCSDRTPTPPTLEERVDDVIAVMDAAGSERATIFGFSEGGSLAALMGAMRPDRVAATILYGTAARYLSDDDHPWGMHDWVWWMAFAQFARDHWGGDLAGQAALWMWAPSMAGDERFKAWLERNMRLGLSPNQVVGHFLSTLEYDLADVFASLRVPTLVLHRADETLVPVAQGRHLAEAIPGAQYVELSGGDHFPFVGDADSVLTEVEAFLHGGPSDGVRQRRLLTLLLTDIVRSTSVAEQLGDRHWLSLLTQHDDIVRNHLARHGGTEIKQTGDGFLATFEGPARAIRCAMGILDSVDRLGLEVRAGVHTGEVELFGDDIAGVAVHLVARAAAAAAQGGIMVTSTVHDLVAGAGIRFGEREEVALAGLTGPRPLYPVLRHGTSPDVIRRMAAGDERALRLDGEYWTAVFDGAFVTLRDSKGLRDLAVLLANPGREVHVLDLAGTVGVAVPGGGVEPMLDAKTRATLRERIADLESDIVDAEGANDVERAATARTELDFLVEELTKSLGVGGRARSTADVAERARKAVTRRIRDAIERIERVHPSLGRHLDVCIRTGAFCSYQPDRPMLWSMG
jgi:pimeloyl-ACP methyl ester carboxylesterase